MPRAKPATDLVSVAMLIEDWSLYPRHTVDGSHVAKMVRSMQAGASLPAVIVDRKSLRIVDGLHRCRAHVKLHGAEAQIECEFRDYENDAELFCDAVACNSSHGRRLDSQDETRITLFAERLGIPLQRIRLVMHIEETKLEEIRLKMVISEGEPAPAKLVAKDFYGQEITPAQASAMNSFSGHRLSQQVTQVKDVIRSGLFRADDHKLCASLHELARLIMANVPMEV